MANRDNMNLKKTHNPANVCIVGLGAMGGSLGLALKHFSPSVEITGVDLRKEFLDLALTRRAIDQGTKNLAEGVRESEFIFLATPIYSICETLKKLPGLIRPDAIVTDLGSTKVEICRAAKKYLPNHFIGGHPMTGSELKGIQGSDPYLFQNAVYLLTPLHPNDKKLNKLARILEKLGALILVTSPELHDQIAAYVSHLPQLVAVALTRTVSEKNKKQPLYKELAAGGFRDLTRIASSPYTMWHDILKSNSSAIRKGLNKFIQRLTSIRKALGTKSLETSFNQAAAFRKKLPFRRKGFIKPLYRVVVGLKDEKGALAHLTDTLAGEDLNISDIELLKVREGFGGSFQLYFAKAEEAERATAALQSAGYEARLLH